MRSPADSALLYGMRDWFSKIALILAFAAPAAAQLLIPGISLQGRIMAYASLFLLMVPIALFRRELRFRTLAVCNICGKFTGAACGIAMAVAGFAMVFIAVSTELTATLLLSPTGARTLATEFWSASESLDYAAAAPFALAMILLSVPLAALLLHRAAEETT